jgi:hypothetical protein
MLRDPARQHSLHNKRNGRSVASTIELAVDSRSRRQGLLGRDRLDPGAALIIAPCSSIHTFFMRFAIDVIFVARDGRVLKTCGAVGRSRIALRLGAFAAIELPAGAIAQADVKRGDMVQLFGSET